MASRANSSLNAQNVFPPSSQVSPTVISPRFIRGTPMASLFATRTKFASRSIWYLEAEASSRYRIPLQQALGR